MSSDVVNSPDDTHDQGLKSKKLSRGKLRRMDSLDMESGTVHGHSHHGSKVCTPHPFMHGNWEKENLIYIYIYIYILIFWISVLKDTKDWSVILHLAFQSMGIVYGDIGTSPLYVYASTFTDGVKHNDDILGVLSIIFYTLTLIPLFKYVLTVLKATDNGEGESSWSLTTFDFNWNVSYCDLLFLSFLFLFCFLYGMNPSSFLIRNMPHIKTFPYQQGKMVY